MAAWYRSVMLIEVCLREPLYSVSKEGVMSRTRESQISQTRLPTMQRFLRQCSTSEVSETDITLPEGIQIKAVPSPKGVSMENITSPQDTFNAFPPRD